MLEIWKNIPDYEGLYVINNYGIVKSLKTNKIKTPFLRPNGYYEITLWKNGKKKNWLVHRLVAKTFNISKSNFKYMQNEDITHTIMDELEINHIDENKLNNFADNLEWCTPKYNCNYGSRNKRIGIANKGGLKYVYK